MVTLVLRKLFCFIREYFFVYVETSSNNQNHAKMKIMFITLYFTFSVIIELVLLSYGFDYTILYFVKHFWSKQ